MPHSIRVAHYLQKDHKFKVDGDSWRFSEESPMTDKSYPHYSRAVFNCELVDTEHKKSAVVKIWMQ
jgi:hypothetical protein